MTEMSSRQRVITALAHQEPDRIPWDCTFSYGCYLRLKKHLGLTPRQDPQPSSNWLSISPPIELLQELQCDLYYVGLGKAKNTPVFEYGMEAYTDAWGVTFRRAPNPSGFHYEFARHPLAHATVKDLDDYPWPDPHDPARVAGLEERCHWLYENTDFALVGKFSESIFEQAFYLRGLEQWLVDLAADPEFAEALMDRLVDISIAMTEVGLKACGKYIQVLRLAGDDMGHQHGTILSPKMFRKLVKPRFARLYHAAKSMFRTYNPNGKLKAHTDGNVYPFIEDYIELGLDVLNPVQPYVDEMDHTRLKSQFGDRLAFHGGIDIQNVLPFGTPIEVNAEAKKTMAALGQGGGYILAPTHYVQPDVPPENILALRDAVLEHGRYPLSR